MEVKAPSSFPLRLDVLDSSGEVVSTQEFVKEKVVLGRILSADLRIDDPRVSRIHALIEVRGEDLILTDLASSHGTFLNEKKVIEAKLKMGDIIRLGFVQIRVERGSGKVSAMPVAFEGQPVFDGEATQVNLDRSQLDSFERRRGPDRRKRDAFPDEKRLDERRDGDRRIDQRQGDRRQGDRRQQPSTGAPGGVEMERRTGEDRRQPRDWERRIGERRRSDRRVFDITSLERRINDRRGRRGDDDVLPEDLEKAFEMPDHARELEVTVLWGDHILDVSNYYEPVTLCVGESPDNDYIIPSEGIPDEFPLINIEEDGTAYLSFTSDMTGTVRAREKIYSLPELQEEKFVRRSGSHFTLPLRQDDFAKLRIGNVNFFILYVKPAPRILPPPMFDRDALLLRTLIGSALLSLLLMVALFFVEEPKPVTIEMIPERLAKVVIKPRPKIPEMVAKQDQEAGSKSGEGAKAPQPEGAAKSEQKPTPEPPKQEKKKTAEVPKPQAKPDPKPAPQVAKKPTPPKPQRKVVDTDKVKKVGLLEAFSKSGAQADLKELMDKDSGVDAFDKGLRSSRGKVGGGGAAGTGLKGVDVGGGGQTIGISGPSTKGLGAGGSGDGIGEGIQGPGSLGQKGEHSVSVISENVQVLSGLPKDVINRIVQQHRGEIRQCYEAARRRNPGIRGKVVIKFTIQPNGIVSYAGVASSTVGDSVLENCMVSRVRTWVFPKPEAPVVTEVSSYPFFLNPGN